VKLTTHLHLVPRTRMRGAISSLPQYAFMAWYSKHGDNFTLPYLYYYNIVTNRVSSVCKATRLLADGWGVTPGIASRRILGPTNLPSNAYRGPFHRPKGAADHSPPPSAEIKNAWSFPFHSPVSFDGVVLRHRDSFICCSPNIFLKITWD